MNSQNNCWLALSPQDVPIESIWRLVGSQTSVMLYLHLSPHMGSHSTPSVIKSANSGTD